MSVRMIDGEPPDEEYNLIDLIMPDEKDKIPAVSNIGEKSFYSRLENDIENNYLPPAIMRTFLELWSITIARPRVSRDQAADLGMISHYQIQIIIII